MNTSDLPANEENRVKAVQALNLLDSKAEERFDRLTRMARRAIDVPVAQLSLIDSERQWFKSSAGAEIQQLERQASICAHTILGNEILVIEDLLDDERVCELPQVCGDPFYRFYAGAPLRSSRGLNIGTLCILDHSPRKLQTEDLEMLRDLSRMAERELRSCTPSTIDPLTGITNCEGFMALAQNRMRLCAREQLPLSVVFFDVNNLMQINDRFGEEEAELMLKVFADLMRESFRDSDVFARIGNDEFVVLLTNASNIYANAIATRFRNLVNTYNREANRGYDLAFSDSVISLSNESDYSIEELLQPADMMMVETRLPWFQPIETASVSRYLE